MQNISLEAGIRSNLFSLTNTTKLLNVTQERLATGKKVNGIVDNPTSFFAARNLNDRADQLSTRLDGMGQSISTINSATAGIDAIRTLLASMKAIVNDAIAESSSTERRTLGDQFNTVLDQLGDVANDSGYAGVNLLAQNQTLSIQFAEGTGDSQLTVQGLDLQSPGGNGVSEVTQQGTATRASAASAGTVFAVTSQAFYSSVACAASSGTSASVSSVASQTSVSSRSTSASQGTVAIDGTNASQASAGSVSSQASQTSIASAAVIASVASGGTSASVASQAAIFSRASIASTGTGAAVSVTFTQQFAFTLQTDASDTSTAVGLRKHAVVNAPLLGNGDHRVDFGSASYLDQLKSITEEIDSMDSSLKTQASRLATNLAVVTVRQTFTESMINELQGGADKLILADMNKEGANLLTLQTRQSIAIQSLSISSQASQQILRLLA